jgi:magnesium chelatase family protein
VVRSRVEKTWLLQLQRSGINNARLGGKQLEAVCEANDDCWTLLERAAERFNLSARAHQRVLRVARTIADLAGVKKIAPSHVAEALSLRCLDRQS